MRKSAREVAFMLIYESLFNKERDVELSFDFFSKEFETEKDVFGENAIDIEDEDYVKQIICLFEANREQIETMIKNNIFGYETDRLYKVDMALLDLAVTEIYHYKTAPAVVINEILEIAKKYSTEKSAKFINGILGSILKEYPVE